jgi:4-carboxymuconolactone decarboxylase
MDKERFERGLAKRKAVLGAEYVEKSLAQADDFSRPFQEIVTEFCWGFGWGDERLPPKTRSMLNLAMIAALNRMHEWELHLKGAIKNGVTQAEIHSGDLASDFDLLRHSRWSRVLPHRQKGFC